MCVGEECNGKRKLPQTWELDHIQPLHLSGSDTFENMQIICPNCHALKTQHERMQNIHISPYFNPNHPKYLPQESVFYIRSK